MHYGYHFISFDFVYVGNQHVRNMLIVIGVVSGLGAIALLVTSVMLIQALRQEYEKQMIPWLVCMASFAAFRLIGFIFAAVVNDMIFAYNILMCLLWIAFTLLNFAGLAFVYSFFLELADMTKLEDLANLRMGTMASLGPASQSVAGSRPTTPFSGSNFSIVPSSLPSYYAQSSEV